MNSNSCDLNSVVACFSNSNTRACESVSACISDIKSGASIADSRVHYQQMFDAFAELVNLDAKLRVALVHSMACMAGVASLVPIESEGERLALAAKDAQDADAESLAKFSAEFLREIHEKVPKHEPTPLLRRLECSLESLEDLQRALDNGEFFLLEGGTTEGFDWAMHTIGCVMEFARVRR